jgi:hypothetical protein
LFVFFLVVLGFDSGFPTCKAGTLLLEPHLYLFFLWLFWSGVLLFALVGLYLHPPIYASYHTLGARHHTQLFSLEMGVS